MNDLIIQTRKAGLDHYLGVCLYADDKQIGCTPNSNYTPGTLINFADFADFLQTLPATTVSLIWEGKSTKAQIEEFFIDYTVGMLFSLIIHFKVCNN